MDRPRLVADGREPIGLFYAWWAGDPLPGRAPPASFEAAPAEREPVLLARLNSLSQSAVLARIEAGHRSYVAWLEGEPVACGWSAAMTAEIGELGIRITLPPGNRYLWDFVTLPAWRGRGIYPRLLQAILARETAEGAERFWIGHDWPNQASGRGILRAGFRPVGALHALPDGRLALFPSGPPERSAAGAALLGVPLASAEC